MEKEMVRDLEHKISAYLKNLDFGAFYTRIVRLVNAEPKIVLTPEVEDRLKDVDVDFRQYVGMPLKNFFTKTPHGAILTTDGEYDVDKDFFKLVNIACYEHVMSISHEYEKDILKTMRAKKYTDAEMLEAIYIFRKQFLQAVYAQRKKHFEKEIKFCRVCYQDLDKYIESCISGAILNMHLLSCRDKTVYSDYAENKKSSTKTI